MKLSQLIIAIPQFAARNAERFGLASIAILSWAGIFLVGIAGNVHPRPPTPPSQVLFFILGCCLIFLAGYLLRALVSQTPSQ